ncbi:hypothetical protein CTheo_1725 [Ceratobasidium theobromae]|uniref:Uncharacterized protein n=1 Tax=Ceratobasidium theobromae TaxID=1582974 RepID=A0A5N5QT46_9AGAM|nr:hypothetical protein CTheo_1725 [Ceratobasidium theobromae]
MDTTPDLAIHTAFIHASIYSSLGRAARPTSPLVPLCVIKLHSMLMPTLDRIRRKSSGANPFQKRSVSANADRPLLRRARQTDRYSFARARFGGYGRDLGTMENLGEASGIVGIIPGGW